MSVVKGKQVPSMEQREEAAFSECKEEEGEKKKEEDTRSTGLRWSLIASLSAEHHSGVSPLLVSAQVAKKVLSTAEVYTSTGTGKCWM